MPASPPESEHTAPRPGQNRPASRASPVAVVLGAGLATVAGAVDVLCISRLGGAFASVVTGNTVVVGASIARRDLPQLGAAATAIAAYGAGVVFGSLITRSARDPAPWPLPTTVVCAVELVALAVLAGVWLVLTGQPTGAWQYVALAAAAVAMGLQTAAFGLVAVSGVTTTYFTGTLTGLLSGLVHKGEFNGAAALALVALLVGALGAGALLVEFPRFAALLPVALLVLILLAGVVARRRARTEGPASTS